MKGSAVTLDNTITVLKYIVLDPWVVNLDAETWALPKLAEVQTEEVAFKYSIKCVEDSVIQCVAGDESQAVQRMLKARTDN